MGGGGGISFLKVAYPGSSMNGNPVASVKSYYWSTLTMSHLGVGVISLLKVAYPGSSMSGNPVASIKSYY